jgi:hypothetical protein
MVILSAAPRCHTRIRMMLPTIIYMRFMPSDPALGCEKRVDLSECGDTLCPGLQRGADRINIIPGERDLSCIGYHENFAARGMTLEGFA